jgi:LPXTG-motif cell wall-anchored protein
MTVQAPLLSKPFCLVYDIDILMCYRFFHNTGAVTGVFLIVGLAAATICLWIFFFIRRRRRRRRIEHASEVSATLAAAGYNRAPIDDEDLGPGPGMRQRFGSFSSQPTISTPITDEERAVDPTVPTANLYDPYAEFGRPVAGSGYMPARSESPSLYSRDRRAEGSSYTSGGSRPGGSHVPLHSTGSADQLLSGGIPPHAIPEPFPISSPMVPPRNPKRQEVQSQDSSNVSGSQNPFDQPPPDYRGRGVAGGDQKR